MPVKLIESTPLAYLYPLLISNLLSAPMVYSPDQKIVHSNKELNLYDDLSKRAACFANLMGEPGKKQGDAIGVMDRDSHRYFKSKVSIKDLLTYFMSRVENGEIPKYAVPKRSRL